MKRTTLNCARRLKVLATLCALPILLAQMTFAQGQLQKNTNGIQIIRSNYAVSFTDPEATFEGARIVHNVEVNKVKGMRIHAKFRVKYGLDNPCRLIAYFRYDDDEGTPLKSGDPNYRDAAGNVSASKNFTPAYDPAVYSDLQMFVPYAALNMESGDDYDLKFYLALYDQEGKRFFGKSGWYKFHLTMP